MTPAQRILRLKRLAHKMTQPEFRRGHTRTAGEVRFIKDKSGDAREWGWNNETVIRREISEKYKYNPRNLKPLTKTLRSALSALGFAMSAYSRFTKIKSATVSPDGNLGGKGYIMKVADMRRQLMNCIEVLSSVTDTLYDEIQAPHWSPEVKELGKRERENVLHVLHDVDEVRGDPEAWAVEQEQKMDKEEESNGVSILG